MISHQAIGKQIHLKPGERLIQQFFVEAEKIPLFGKQHPPAVPPIENMINRPRLDLSAGAWHGTNLSQPRQTVKNQRDPLYVPKINVTPYMSPKWTQRFNVFRKPLWHVVWHPVQRRGSYL